MAIYEYALATGHDATSLTNIETIITTAPVGKPIPLGSVRRLTLNNKVQTNGTKIVQWFWGAMSFTDFDTLITYIFGDYDTETANMTIDTRGRDNVMHRGNVVALLPIEGEDYKRRDHGNVEELTITFRQFEEVGGGGGFSTGFSLGFEA